MDHALVGRHAERAALHGWLDDVTGAGTSRLVLVAGEPGAGKTSLMAALVDEARARGLATAWGRVAEQGGAPPFWAWRQLTAQLDAPELLLGDGGDESGERFLLFERVTRAIRERTRPPGLVLALDDLHQADQPTLRMLVHVAGGVGDLPVLVLGTFRSDEADHAEGFAEALSELTRLPSRRGLDLGRLDAGAVSELLGPGADATLAQRVHELTGGNPLFVIEVARHLAGGGALGDVPGTVRAVVAARLARRSPACRTALRAAAVIGRRFGAGVLATVLDRPALEVAGLLHEGVQAALVRADGAPGRYVFAHELVRDGIEADLAGPELVVLHRQVAEAIERYEGVGRDTLADLARHWDHASVAGGTERAARWSERAAESADGLLAWEESARLYDRALVLAGPGGDPVARHRRLLGSARARSHCDDLTRAVARCIEAGELARRTDRGDLLAEAVLVLEGRGGSGGPDTTQLLALAEDALAATDPGDRALRVRLLSLLTSLCFYADPHRSDSFSDAALAESASTDDPLASVAAARARQMVTLATEHAAERLVLADRLGRAGRALSSPAVLQWETLWRIEALTELGRLPEAFAELAELRRRVDALALPESRWHLARLSTVLMVATGRWSEARREAQAARTIFSRLEGADVATSLDLNHQVSIQVHTGFVPEVLDDYDRLDLTSAPSYLGDVPVVMPLLPLAETGRRDEAHELYSRLAPVGAWHPPAFLWLSLHVMRLMAAVVLDRLDDVAPLWARLERHRGYHAGGGGGGGCYLGPVEVHLGEGALALGRWDDAVTDLRQALDASRRVGAAPSEVRAAVLLVEALGRRAGEGDATEARALADRYRDRARLLDMQPWLGRLDAAALVLDRSASGPLSARELEVVALVAKGMTNKAVADRLYLSDRTVQNHVQHVLTKLGLANRTEIAAWYHRR